jgi:hypothetical protein
MYLSSPDGVLAEYMCQRGGDDTYQCCTNHVPSSHTIKLSNPHYNQCAINTSSALLSSLLMRSMDPPLLWPPPRMCILPLQHYSYHGAPQLVH